MPAIELKGIYLTAYMYVDEVLRGRPFALHSASAPYY